MGCRAMSLRDDIARAATAAIRKNFVLFRDPVYAEQALAPHALVASEYEGIGQVVADAVLAGLAEDAAALEGLPELTSAELVDAAMPVIRKAQKQADAARDAAGDALAPTVSALQESAFDLLDRMLAVSADIGEQ